MKPMIVFSFLTLAAITPELPIDTWAKLGVQGACLLIVWWVLARTLPAMAESNRSSLSEQHKTYLESANQLREAQEQTSSKLCEKLDRVNASIEKGNDAQIELLKSTLAWKATK